MMMPAGCRNYLQPLLYLLVLSILSACNSTATKRESVRDIKERGIFMQQEDYSCGAASLATLMHFYFGEQTDESHMLATIKAHFSPTDYARIEQDGLSFLELETISHKLGFQTASVRLVAAALAKLRGPVIVYLERREYRHFAVFKGILEDRVFIADPSRGNIRIPLHEFLDEWDGRTFIVGKAGFNASQPHPLSIPTQRPLRHELLSLRSKLHRPTSVEPGFRSPLSTLRQAP